MLRHRAIFRALEHHFIVKWPEGIYGPGYSRHHRHDHRWHRSPEIEYGTFVPRTIDDASRAEHKALQLKRQLEAEEEAAALAARLNAQRLERENKAREAALQIEHAKIQQQEAERERRRRAEMERRERQNYVDNYRKTHGGCDPGYNRYCTYVGGMVAGCSCM